jgi:1,4-dihydroxy-2-naphthoate octaprenyltransferase
MTSPDKRARTRPIELVGVAGVLALFGGLVVLMSTRDLILAGIAFGVAFIVTLVVLAILVLVVNPVEDARKGDDDEPQGH